MNEPELFPKTEFPTEAEGHWVNVYPITWMDKIRSKLFPYRYKDCDLIKSPEKYRDIVSTETTCELSFIDRIRVLISGRFKVESRTATENIVGYAKTTSCFFALPPRWMERKDK